MMNKETPPPTTHGEPRVPLAPGVHYETLVAQTAQPVFRTGVPVFVGFGQFKPDEHKPYGIRHFNRWQQFIQTFITLPNHYLSHAVRGFFENGGGECVVVAIQGNFNKSTAMMKALAEIFADGSMLEDFEDVDLVCVPDAMIETIRKAGHSPILEIQSAALAHCRKMGDRFAILDGIFHEENGTLLNPEETRIGVDLAISHWRRLPVEHGVGAEYGALYHPWISVKKPHLGREADISHGLKMPCDIYAMESVNSSPGSTSAYVTEPVPPCGHIAGIYSRTDSRVGVHKAPANEILKEVLKLEMNHSDDEQAALNEAGVNCLRNFAGYGIRVWGARTLSGQPHWAYVNVRRIFLTLTRWIKINMSDLVYETNNPRLWECVRERLTDYCRILFDQGALMGSNPTQAFFVKCDAETNPVERQEAGEVVADVGLAPTIPAEFIVIRITQRPGTVVVTGLNVS